MKALGGFSFALVLACGLYAQNRGSTPPTVSGSFGSVVFPGGTPATSSNVTRSFGSVVSPGGGGPHGNVVPGFSRLAHRTPPAAAYAYPVYVGGYGGGAYGGYYDAYGQDQQPASQQQPNITVVMPPQQPVTPVIINVGAGGGQYMTTGRQQGVYEAPLSQSPEEPVAGGPAASDETQHFLIAFKDHTIYSAIAYWVDGDTLHYFTSGNTHNQVSVSLVDRNLSERLNKESGVDFKIPAAK